jgi:two-component system sensor histidine kinase MprB
MGRWVPPRSGQDGPGWAEGNEGGDGGWPEAAPVPEPVPAGAKSANSGRQTSWLRQISFRMRISVLVAGAVGLAVAMAAVGTYIGIRSQMERQANSDLQSAVTELLPGSVQFDAPNQIAPRPFIALQTRTGDEVQVIIENPGGLETYAVQAPQNNLPSMPQMTFFKVTALAKKTLASPSNSSSVQDMVGADGNSYDVETVSVIPGHLAVEVAYPLSNMDNTLADLRLMLLLGALGGMALAAILGWAVGRASMRPVEDLTLAAEHVAHTQDLSATIDETGNDELSRLAHSFNAMLAALAASRRQQSQLVSDAGHELRTPLTSLRTNIEVLMRTKDLAGPDREELLADVDGQLKELSTLVGDLVDMAREDERPQAEPIPVPLNDVVERAVERAQRRAMSVHFDVSLEPGHVVGQPALLERAVMNVLDNAAKWSPPGGHVTVDLKANSAWHLTVTDQGPGIAAEDLPHIFDRFYRAQSARSMPGSGLGLAIVKGVVTSHGGTIDISPRPGGGTRVDIALPLEAGEGATGESERAGPAHDF